MIQRGSTTVVSIDPSLKLTYALYEVIALEDGDLLSSVNTFEVTKRNFKLVFPLPSSGTDTRAFAAYVTTGVPPLSAATP
jgi:hypothetical protein